MQEPLKFSYAVGDAGLNRGEIPTTIRDLRNRRKDADAKSTTSFFSSAASNTTSVDSMKADPNRRL